MRRDTSTRLILGAAVLLGCSPLYGPTGAVLAPASADPASVASGAVGCWELSWDVGPEQGSAPPPAIGPLPDSVVFEDAALFGDGRRLVTPATHPSGRGFQVSGATDASAADAETPWERVYRSNRWWTEDDRVTVVFSDGDTRLWSVTLEPVDEALTGSAIQRVGSGPDRGSVEAAVRARRIACPPA